MPGENLDLTSDTPRAPRRDERRRFVGIHFVCCDVYTRIYVNREGTAYRGYCPRCFKPVELKIGPGGTDSRFFTVQ